MTAPQVVVFNTPPRFDFRSFRLLIMRTLLAKLGADDALERTDVFFRKESFWPERALVDGTGVGNG
jgi:hypothetical protein